MRILCVAIARFFAVRLREEGGASKEGTQKRGSFMHAVLGASARQRAVAVKESGWLAG